MVRYGDDLIDKRKFLSQMNLYYQVQKEMENENNEPVMCSKCNKTFESESEYLEHYNEKHKPEKT